MNGQRFERKVRSLKGECVVSLPAPWMKYIEHRHRDTPVKIMLFIPEGEDDRILLTPIFPKHRK